MDVVQAFQQGWYGFSIVVVWLSAAFCKTNYAVNPILKLCVVVVLHTQTYRVLGTKQVGSIRVCIPMFRRRGAVSVTQFFDPNQNICRYIVLVRCPKYVMPFFQVLQICQRTNASKYMREENDPCIRRARFRSMRARTFIAGPKRLYCGLLLLNSE